MMIINTILFVIPAYLLMGFIFAIAFVIKGVNAVDESAREGSWGFRIIIIPGAMVFWPLLLRKWIKASASIRPVKEKEASS